MIIAMTMDGPDDDANEAFASARSSVTHVRVYYHYCYGNYRINRNDDEGL
jgi:hypothetical protein